MEAVDVYTFFEAGKEFYLRDEFDAAGDRFAEGLLHAQQEGDERLQSLFLNVLGLVAIETGTLENARSLLLNALAIRTRRNEPSELADTWNNLGVVYRRQGQFRQARTCYLRALRLYGPTGKKELVTNTLHNLGEVHAELGQFPQALATHQRALRAYQELGDPRAIADSLNSLGMLHTELGHLDQAVACFTQALDLYGTEHHPAARARTLNNLANLYDDLGRFEQALETHLQARTLKAGLGNSQSLAYTLANLGAVYQHLGRLEEAQDVLQQALQLRQSLPNPQELAFSYSALGHLLQRLGQQDQALGYHQQALALLEPLGNKHDVALALLGAGLACCALERFEEAHAYYLRAWTLYKRLGNPQQSAQCLDCLGKLYVQQGQHAEAERCFARSLRYLEAVHDQIGEASQLGALRETMPDFHARFAELYLTQHRPAEALSVVERGRASGLARQAALSGNDFAQFLSAQDAGQLQTYLQKRTQAIRQLHALQDVPDLTGDLEQAILTRQRAVVQEEYQQAERQYALCREGLLARYPEYRRVQGYTPPTHRQLLALARRHADTLYLEWAVNDRTTLLFALSHQEGLHSFTLPIGKEGLNDLAQTWRKALTDKRYREPDKARALAQSLLAPLEAGGWLVPNRFAHLVLVADAPLLEVPLAALAHESGRRLLDTHAVSSAISLGTLIWPVNPRQSTASLLCVADPTSSHSSNISTKVRGDFGPLHYARQEAQRISSLFPHALRLTGTRAREGRVKREMPHYSLLHFATHGVPVPTSGLLSWLRLATEPETSQEDGCLEGREIMTLPLSAQLAVLSACDTALGQVQGGEGMLGLAWAFRAAGCASVLASLWHVDDAATALLMEHFYRALISGQHKDAALQEAVAAARKTCYEPYLWAAFQLMGDTSPLRPFTG